MRRRDQAAVHVTPLFLRLALAVVFLWSGSSKLFYTDEYGPEQAAVLAEIGVIEAPGAAADGDDAEGEGEADEPIRRPDTPTAPAEGDGGEPASESEPAPTSDDEGNAGGPAETAGDDAGTSEEADADGAAEPEGEPIVMTIAQSSSAAAEFAEPVEARRLYSIAVLTYVRANPPDGSTPLWPGALAQGPWPRVLAWAAALTEFVGGVFILMGFLTRLVALSFAGVMVVAALLTTLGPAAVSGDALLGFLPRPALEEGDWVTRWRPWLFQLMIFAGAMGVVCSGPGGLSVDALLLRRRARRIAKSEGARDSEDDG